MQKINEYGETIVQCIASFNTKGDILPLYIRVYTEDYGSEDIKVRMIVCNTSRIAPDNVLDYTVELEYRDRLIPAKLFYFIRQRQWRLKIQK